MTSPVVTLLYPLPGAGSPAKFIDSKNPVIRWTFEDAEVNPQTQIQVEIYSYPSHVLMWDSGPVTILEDMTGEAMLSPGLMYLWSDRYYEVPDTADLHYDVDYTIRMRAKDSTGEWSAFTPEARFILDTTSVNGLEVNVAPDLAALRISWISSSADGLEGYNILRAKESGGIYRKLNKELVTAAEFYDMKVASGKEYFYRVEMVADGGNTSEMSAPVAGSVIFTEWYLESLHLEDVTDFSKNRNRAQNKRTALGANGRIKRVVQDGGYLPEDMSITFLLLDDEISTGSEKFDQLMSFLDLQQLISLRDPFGRQWTVAPGNVEDTMLRTGSLEYEIKLDLSEVIE